MRKACRIASSFRLLLRRRKCDDQAVNDWQDRTAHRSPPRSMLVRKWCDSAASVLGIVSAPMPKNTPSKLSFAPRSPSLTSAASALVAPLRIPPPKPMANTQNCTSDCFRRTPCLRARRRRCSDAPTEHPAIAKPIDDRSKNQRANENAERQQGGERADRSIIEPEPLGQHVVDRAERQEHDAEQQHPQASRGEDKILADTSMKCRELALRQRPGVRSQRAGSAAP